MLGSLLFNLCLANLPSQIQQTSDSTLLLFADDKTLYACRKSLDDACSVVFYSLNSLCQDLAKKGLSINTDRPVCMAIRPLPQNKPVSMPRVCCNGIHLRVVHKAWCSGLIINNQLTSSTHVLTICTKVGRKNWLPTAHLATALPTSSPPPLPLCQ